MRIDTDGTESVITAAHQKASKKNFGVAPDCGKVVYGRAESCDAADYAKLLRRSYDAVIRVYDAAGNVIDRHEHAGDFKEP